MCKHVSQCLEDSACCDYEDGSEKALEVSKRACMYVTDANKKGGMNKCCDVTDCS